MHEVNTCKPFFKAPEFKETDLKLTFLLHNRFVRQNILVLSTYVPQ